MPLPPHDFRDRSRYRVSTNRQWRCTGRYRGQSMIDDAQRPGFVADDAERWLERQWAKAHGIDLGESA